MIDNVPVSVPAITGEVLVTETRGDIFLLINRRTEEAEQGIAMVEAPNRKRLAELIAGIDFRVVPAAAVPDAALLAAMGRVAAYAKARFEFALHVRPEDEDAITEAFRNLEPADIDAVRAYLAAQPQEPA